jgi:hypothetical protein
VIELQLLGRALVAEIQTPAIERWIRDHWHFPEHDVPDAAFTVSLAERSPPVLPGYGTSERLALHRVALPAVRHENAWVFGDAAAGVRLWHLPDAAEIDVWGARDEAAHARIFAGLFVALGDALRASGLLPLHASIAVRDDRATAMTGASGVGKTSTLWRAFQTGWAPLAEDFAWLDPVTLAVYGWDRGVRLTPDARTRFAPALDLEGCRFDADGKTFVPYDRGPTRRVPSAKLGRLLQLQRGPGAFPSGELSAREAVRAWWEAVGVPITPEVRARVASEIADLVRRIPARRLVVDAEPLEL